MKVGANTSTIIDVNKQRKMNNITPLKCNCNTCLYFNGKSCKFNKSIDNRKQCIKYEFSNPSLARKKKKPKKKKSEAGTHEVIIKKTTYEKLSNFLGIKITHEALQTRYRSYDKGYSIKIKTEEPLVIVLRNNKTKERFYYEIIG